MEQQTVELSNKLQALIIRACAKQKVCASQFLELALREHIEAKLPKARFIVKAAEALGIESPVAKLIKKAAKKKGGK